MGKTIITNTYELKDDYAILKIIGSKHGELEVFISIEDVEKCKTQHWNVNKFGWYKKKYFYVVNQDLKFIHRIITDCPEDMVVDHINGNTLDNRRNNLKICTGQENRQKASLTRNNKSGYMGVYWYNHCPTPKWVASIKINGKRIHLGYFIDLDEAIKARKEAELKYFGDYAPQKYIEI